MHPAVSLIVFTTFSGAGFGLLAFLGVGLPRVEGWAAFAFFAIGYALAGGGLIASALHLGRPERMLLGFSQWRSSWLSREAWASVTTLAVTGLFALTVLAGAPVRPLGWLGAALCLATIFCTAMIYAQLKTVPRWHHWSTPALFLGLGVTGGALLAGQLTLAGLVLILAGVGQFAWWRAADTRAAAGASTVGTATGLAPAGKVRLFEPPHTGGNYLTREMVHVVARRHAQKLRLIALALGFGLPALLLLAPFTHIAAVLAILSHIAGIAVSRWLFFAEAEHVVGLYYGRPGFGDT